MRLIFIMLAMAGGLFAQQQDHYIAEANSTALTLQQPATNARQISFPDLLPGAWVYCASASTATLSFNGTVTTATAGSEKKLPGTQQPSGMTIWTATNQSSAGTSLLPYQISAGQTYPIYLPWFRFGTQGTGANITITTNNSCTITFAYLAV